MPDYEVELKYPLHAQQNDLPQRLIALGASPLGRRSQEDIYFSHPVRDFSTTDEALRLRRDGDQNVITYKGPLLDSLSKTRQEIELQFAPGEPVADQMWAMLRALGFHDVRRVRKQRQEYTLRWEDRAFKIALDEVAELGDYIELETLTVEEEWQSARDSALRLAETLSLASQERRSYLELLLIRDAEAAE